MQVGTPIFQASDTLPRTPHSVLFSIVRLPTSPTLSDRPLGKAGTVKGGSAEFHWYYYPRLLWLLT